MRRTRTAHVAPDLSPEFIVSTAIAVLTCVCMCTPILYHYKNRGFATNIALEPNNMLTELNFYLMIT